MSLSAGVSEAWEESGEALRLLLPRGATIQVHTARHGSLPRRRVGVPDDEGGVRAPLHGAGDLQRESVPRRRRRSHGKWPSDRRSCRRTSEHWPHGRRARGRAAVRVWPRSRRRCAASCRGQHMTDLFAVTIQEAKHGLPVLRYRFDRAAYTALQRRRLGKTLLFTDHSHWSDEDIVSAYRGQHHVENAFRQMKDVHYVSFRPAHHCRPEAPGPCVHLCARAHAASCLRAGTQGRPIARPLLPSSSCLLPPASCLLPLLPPRAMF